MGKARYLLFVAALAACGGDAPPACEGLDEAACDAESACTPMFGAEDCGAGAEVYAGCATAEAVEGCDEAETPGGSADGSACLLFSSSCMPDGFEACGCDTGS